MSEDKKKRIKRNGLPRFVCVFLSSCVVPKTITLYFTLYNDFYREKEITNHAVTYECQRIKKKELREMAYLALFVCFSLPVWFLRRFIK